MNIISSNPYRLLGVYSNSPIKDRVANTNRLKAYLKVGKSVGFPTDFSNLMPVPVRTIENMEQANASINLPQDQLKSALFWFIDGSSIDNIAFGHLQKGDAAKAKDIFSKKETFSSLVNQGVLSLIQDDKASAIQCLTKVIHDENYRGMFIESVCGSTFQISEDDLAQFFIDELLVEIPVQELKQLFSDNGNSANDDDYLKNKAIDGPIVTINAEIAQAKSVKNDDFAVQYRAGLRLMNQTKESLKIIKGLLGTGDAQYQQVADNLAKSILQCGINYYNNSQEYDAPTKAIILQKYALDIAVGKFTKDRCQQNYDILKKTVDAMPPKEVFAESQAIQMELAKFCKLPDKICYAITLLNNTKPQLQSIKDKLGVTNIFYLNLSTQVVGNALHNVIEEVNESQKDEFANIGGSQGYESILQLQNRERKITRVKNALQAAWEAITLMDYFDLEYSFKTNRYIANKKILRDMWNQLGIGSPNRQSSIPKDREAGSPNRQSSIPKDREVGSPIRQSNIPKNKEGASNILLSWGFMIAIIIIILTLLFNS